MGEVSGGMYLLIMFMYCVCPVLILMDFASAVCVCEWCGLRIEL